jgi:transcriptional regulator with XRE-family HTH domain
MAMRYPEDFGPEELEEGPTAREVHVSWDPNSDFGGYLKTVRERMQWTTREAAAKFGVSQTYISKLENHRRKKAPSYGLLERIAEVYGLDLKEVMREAGYRFRIPIALELKLAIDVAFRVLVNDPRFRPVGFEPDHERFYAPQVKQQMVDLALKVAQVVYEEDFDFQGWLRKEVDP